MNQTPKYGDWIFTCSLKPLQFHSFKDNELDDFITIEGSEHSRKNCGLKIVSEKYAKFFLESNLDQYYNKFNIDFKTLSHLEKVNHSLFKRKKDDVIIYYIGKEAMELGIKIVYIPLYIKIIFGKLKYFSYILI